MSEYIIVCPACKKQYKLIPNNLEALAGKSFLCPKCSYSVPFPALIKELQNIKNKPTTQETSSPVTHSDKPAQHSETKVSRGAAGQQKASITVLSNNAKFIVNPGIYIIGRKSSDSMATLQIAPDISMSRQHARLVAQLVAGKLVVQISGLKAYNPVLINGKLLPHGNPYTLKNGDTFQLGNTRCLFAI